MPRLIAVVLVILTASVVAAPVPRLKKNQWLISMEGDLYMFTEGDEKPTKLTDGKVKYSDPAWSPDGKHIAYCAAKEGSRQIFRMDADGKNVVQLTHTQHHHSAPNWSPDGVRIAFAREAGEDRVCGICTLDAADGKDLKVLSTSDESTPVFSPDGNSIAGVAQREAEYAVYTMNADGKNLTRLVRQPVFSIAMVPAWSLDGKQIAVTLLVEDGYELHLVQPDGRGLKAVTKFGNRKTARSPSWSPNGKQLSFLLGDRSDDTKDPCSLWVMDANGENPKELLKLGADAAPLFTTAHWRPR
jgi:Tol biopolymer transport system component